MMKFDIRSSLLAAAVMFACVAAPAQQVDQLRGVDAAVDYSVLKRIAPWDDRNYALTAADLALLSENERELSEAIPVFYRVQLRKAYPDMLRSGPVQYPRSALPHFLIEQGGYLIDGKFYRKAQREASGDWAVLTDLPVAELDEQGGYRSLEGEVRVTNPTGAAESTIEVSPVNPDIVVAGSNGPGSGQKMHYSFNGGASWTQSAALPLGGTCCDPTIAWSSDGQYVYTATLGSQVWFYRSDDNGITWDSLADEPGNDPRREITAGGFEDKEFLHVDLSPTSPFQDNIYLTWHESNTMRFARSTDFGHTWGPVISFSSATNKRGIGSDITTDAAGNVYYFWPAFNARTILVAKSTNGGGSFQPDVTVAATQASFDFPIPSMESRRAWIYVSADADRSSGPFAGSVYAAWTDTTAPDSDFNANANHARVRVAYSRNGGSTWSTVTPHPTADANTVDRWNQWLAVGPDGSVHLIFYDTTGDASRSSVNLYYTVSQDGAQSWSAPERLTSVTSPNINDSFEFGDYNGLAATMSHVISSYTDNRNESGGGGNSVDIYAVGKAIGGGNPVYTLAPTSPGQAGVVNTWNTSNGTAGGGNLVYFGLSTGSTAVSVGQCNVNVGLSNARPIAFANADGSGNAAPSRVIPAGAAGRTIRFQALDLGSCGLSNVTTTTF